MNNLLFLPIDVDLPYLEFPRLSQIKTDVMGASFWDYEQLLDPNIDSKFPWRTDLDAIRQKYKDLIHRLPFESLENVRLSIQSKSVKPHIDISDETKNSSLDNYNHYLQNEPCGYRIVISGERSSLKLLVSSKVITASIPSIPCIYIINSTSCRHFIEKDIGRQTIYIRGRVNTVAHNNLIKKSLEKFKNYAIFST